MLFVLYLDECLREIKKLCDQSYPFVDDNTVFVTCKEDATIMSHVPSLTMQLELPWSDLLVERQPKIFRQVSMFF